MSTRISTSDTFFSMARSLYGITMTCTWFDIRSAALACPRALCYYYQSSPAPDPVLLHFARSKGTREPFMQLHVEFSHGCLTLGNMKHTAPLGGVGRGNLTQSHRAKRCTPEVAAESMAQLRSLFHSTCSNL
jgi:hypothetical protein